mmetsp:Transcript_42490/g.85192  ORF Transcript_42490/g.85192 Transcript_42490/m.85192 type:complete len:277 (+) Transcript_42490:1386-2216(+)
MRHLIPSDEPAARERCVDLRAILSVLCDDITHLLLLIHMLARLRQLSQSLDAPALDLRDLLILLGQLDLPHVLNALVPVRLTPLCALTEILIEDSNLLRLHLKDLLLTNVPVAQLLLPHHLAPQRERHFVGHWWQRCLELALCTRTLDHLHLVEARRQTVAKRKRLERKHLRVRAGRHDIFGRIRIGLCLRLAVHGLALYILCERLWLWLRQFQRLLRLNWCKEHLRRLRVHEWNDRATEVLVTAGTRYDAFRRCALIRQTGQRLGRKGCKGITAR